MPALGQTYRRESAWRQTLSSRTGVPMVETVAGDRAKFRITRAGLAAVAVVAVVWVGSWRPGYALASLLIFAAGFVVAVSRRDETAQHVVTVRLQEIAEFPEPCSRLWALIKPAESASALEPSIKRGYREPGTPLGLGERQVFELLDGSTLIFAVVEYQHERRAVTTQVVPEPDMPMRNIFSLEPVERGCVFTFQTEIDVPAGSRLPSGYEQAWRASMRAQFDGIRDLLAGRNPAPHL